MQAIQTKYLPATNTRDSRIKAWCDAGSHTIPYPHELSGMDVYQIAAQQLVERLGWTGEHYGTLHGVGLPNQAGYCFVMVK